MNTNTANMLIQNTEYNGVSINELGNEVSQEQELIESTKMELQESYNALDTNQFLGLIFTLVIISMIFESGMKFVKSRIDKKKAEQEPYSNYKKAMIILLSIYALFLIIFFIISNVILEFPVEIIIALEIASIFMVLVNTFFRWRMLLPKKKK